jgi:hypothetical protein
MWPGSSGSGSIQHATTSAPRFASTWASTGVATLRQPSFGPSSRSHRHCAFASSTWLCSGGCRISIESFRATAATNALQWL